MGVFLPKILRAHNVAFFFDGPGLQRPRYFKMVSTRKVPIKNLKMNARWVKVKEYYFCAYPHVVPAQSKEEVIGVSLNSAFRSSQ